jgi:hypothetical protein
MPEDLHQIAAAAAKNIEIAAMRIALEPFLYLQSQPLHAATHVRMARRDPDPTAGRNGNQDRSAFNVAATNAAVAFAPIRIRAPFISTMIAPSSGSRVGEGEHGVSSTITRAKPDALTTRRASRRHL